MRAGLNAFHRAIEAAQDHLLIFQLCRRVWDRYIDAAVLAGKLQAPGYADDKRPWRQLTACPHGWPFVHLLQDAQAKQVLLDTKRTSREEEREKMPGASIEEIDEQRKQDEAREENLGLADRDGGTVLSPAIAFQPNVVEEALVNAGSVIPVLVDGASPPPSEAFSRLPSIAALSSWRATAAATSTWNWGAWRSRTSACSCSGTSGRRPCSSTTMSRAQMPSPPGCRPTTRPPTC